jgi:ribosomal-protein-alanine N-acetyltransferase
MTLPEEFSIRAMSESDLGAVLALERQSEAAPHWSESEYLICIQPDNQSTLKRIAMVAEVGGEVAGFVIVRLVGGFGSADAELESIIVSADWRRRGLGLLLLLESARRAKEQRASRLDLEVRASNAAAVGLYRRAGFRETGIRRGYYRDPEEDAVLMSVSL